MIAEPSRAASYAQRMTLADPAPTAVPGPSEGTSPVRGPVRSGTWVALLVGASLLFAVNGTVAKLAMQAGLSPSRLVELRSLGSAVVLLLAVGVAARSRLPRGRELVGLALLGFAGVAMVQWLYFVAISHLPVGVALLIEYTAPLLVALWARFVLGEQVGVRLWWGLLACLSGLALVAQVGPDVRLDAIGLVAAAGAAVSLAAYYLLGARVLDGRAAVVAVRPRHARRRRRPAAGARRRARAARAAGGLDRGARHRRAVRGGARGRSPARAGTDRADRDARAGGRRRDRLGRARGVDDRAAGGGRCGGAGRCAAR